jgi:hypothetical protein
VACHAFDAEAFETDGICARSPRPRVSRLRQRLFVTAFARDGRVLPAERKPGRRMVEPRLFETCFDVTGSTILLKLAAVRIGVTCRASIESKFDLERRLNVA